jgi:periplasmic protein TonB
MGKLFLSSSIDWRPALVVSLMGHAAVVVAVSRPIAAPPRPAARIDEVAVDVEVPAPPLPPEELVPPAVAPLADPHVTYPAHAHSAPRRDDRPRDPAPAAPPVLSEATDPVLPRFSIVLGSSNAVAGGTVAADGTKQGAEGASRASAAGAEEEAPTVSVPAYLVSSGRPEYPAEARAAGLEGDVQLEIVVDSRGRVVASKLLRSAGHGFDESALKAIPTYRFAPAQYQGGPVRVRMPWVVSFRLE